jgi:hypothetical protein
MGLPVVRGDSVRDYFKRSETMSALTPSPTLLVKLGSIAVHVDEFFSSKGNYLDRVAIIQLLDDPEIVAWLAEMGKLALLPVKR